jgi:hypothetical protein
MAGIRGSLSAALGLSKPGDFFFIFDPLAVSISGLFPIEVNELVRQLAFMLVDEFGEVASMPYGDLLNIDVGNDEGAKSVDPFGIKHGLALHDPVELQDRNVMADVVGIHRIEDALDALVHEVIGILAKLLGFLKDAVVQVGTQGHRDSAGGFGFIFHDA